MITRPRRLRQNPVLRKMVRETRMDASSLIYPMFVREGSGIKEEIPAMEGQYRYTTNTMLYALEDLEKAGVRSVMFFGIPDVKAPTRSLCRCMSCTVTARSPARC